MPFFQPYLAIGFHSCDREVGLRVINGGDDLRPSKNVWDWLGPGVYFWEQNPSRALEYAKECAQGLQTFAGKISTPFVIGAIIELRNCLNLLEPNSIKSFEAAHKRMLDIFLKSGFKVPVNKGADRQLDCSVFRCLHELNNGTGATAIDTIRCPFHEGGELYPGANFSKRLHMEICVRNPDCIRGYFLPRPLDLFNPYLKKNFLPH